MPISGSPLKGTRIALKQPLRSFCDIRQAGSLKAKVNATSTHLV